MKRTLRKYELGISTFWSVYLSISFSRSLFPIFSQNDTCYSVGFIRDHRWRNARTYGPDSPRWNKTGATHRNHFSGFARRNVFLTSYRSAHHARGADFKILLGSVRVEIFLQRDLDSLLLSTEKSTVYTCERQERKRYANAVVVRDGYSPPKVWHVSGGAQVSALTARRTLENDIAGRVITGRRILSRGQHPENKREFTVSVSFWHGPP